MPQTAPIRRRLPTTPKRRKQTGGRPGRTLGDGSRVQRGQLKPRTLTLRTSHFPDLPTATIQLKDTTPLDTERRRLEARAHHRRALMNPQLERCDHTEETGPCAARGPIQIGVMLGVAVDLFAVGRHDIQAEHALACHADCRTVPAVSALQEKAAEANTLAVA